MGHVLRVDVDSGGWWPPPPPDDDSGGLDGWLQGGGNRTCADSARSLSSRCGCEVRSPESRRVALGIRRLQSPAQVKRHLVPRLRCVPMDPSFTEVSAGDTTWRFDRRYGELFAAEFDVLLYDLTSSYVEGAAEKDPMMRRGYSHDHRPDCPQVVIALLVNGAGF